MGGNKNAERAPPGNRTRVARMGILHDTTTPAALLVYKGATSECSRS